ncbi:MAG: TonB-dependent receptor [Acidobacteriota bacterium]
MILFLGGLFLAASAWAQTAALKGTIKDPSSKPVAGVAIQVVNIDSGQRLDTTTNAQGEFQVGALVPGGYTVRAEYQGANLASRIDILQQGQTIDLGTLTVAAAQSAQAPAAQPAATQNEQPADVTNREAVTVTARRVEEELQDVPIPVSVVSGEVIEKAAAFNINRIKELIPTVQFYSSNPRNSAINIRGLGAPFGLTNDGIDQGVGFYVDGVYYARPAAATLDFVDLERIEILRGPQGTLFGKNTTAGAINITTRKPTFNPEARYELSYGNFGFIQAKASVSGPLIKDKLAARISFSGTQRDGMLYNVRTQDDVNDLNNLGIRGQVLYLIKPNLSLLVSADYTRQRPEGYAQVIAGVAPTLRPLNRQYAAMAADLNYKPPSFNPFDRLIDTDTPWRSNQTMGGGSVTLEWDRGPGLLTAITAWRYWDWNPSNDRDFTGLPITTVSAAPSRQTQWTQEIRYAGRASSRLTYLIGAFYFGQRLNDTNGQKTESGSAAARFSLTPNAAANTPGLLNGYGQNVQFDLRTASSAIFGQVEYSLTEKLKITPGVRYNYDIKNVNYNQTVYGGLQTTDPALIALQRSVYSPLAYAANVSKGNVSGQLTLSYKVSSKVNTYVTYSTGYKPVGVNLGGVPLDANNVPVRSAAIVRPEDVRNLEIGVKTAPFKNVTANFSAFNTDIKNFQTQVVNGQVGVVRGYLANARKVRVRGIEFDGTAKLTPEFSVYASAAFTDGRYISFPDAPPPLEETGGPQVKDISGSVLPGISKWAVSYGGEYVIRKTLFTLPGEYFLRMDASYRSVFSSNPTASRYLNVQGYPLFNPRVGFRARDGWAITLWARNATDRNYFELLSPQPGNSGLYVGLPGDRRTVGLTLSQSFGK